MDQPTERAPSAPPAGARRPRAGLRADLHRRSAGPVVLGAQPDHRLHVHAGAPARASCNHRRFHYTRGDVDILPAGTAGGWVDEDESATLVLRLPPSFLVLAAEDMGLDPARAGLELRHQMRDPQIEHLAWALEAESGAGHPNGLLYTDGLGAALAVHLLGRYAAPAKHHHGLPPRQRRRVVEYIESHLDQDLSLAKLARVAEISASYLKPSFKRSMGVPVHEYVIQRRVERAKTLLLRGGLPASQVALEAGFAHQSHMARCMRRVLGVTPSAVARGGRGGRET